MSIRVTKRHFERHVPSAQYVPFRKQAMSVNCTKTSGYHNHRPTHETVKSTDALTHARTHTNTHARTRSMHACMNAIIVKKRAQRERKASLFGKCQFVQ